MKTTLLVIILTAFILPVTYSQTISSVALKEVNSEYISISSSHRPGNKIGIHLDFGQANLPFKIKDNLLLDENEKPMEFNSIIDAINFLSKYGYELVETYVVPSETSGYAYHILKKKKE